MAFLSVNKENFPASVSTDGIVMVDCWAPWCGACEEFREKFERTAALYPQHDFASLNCEEEKDLVEKLDIKHLPTLLVYREGTLLFQQPGNFGDEELVSILSQTESLDMDHVRAEIAAERSRKEGAENPPGGMSETL